MTQDCISIEAYLTGRIDTPTGSKNSLAFDLTGLDLRSGGVLAAELLLEQPVRRCAVAELRGDTGEACYGVSTSAAGAAPFRLRLNDEALRDIQRASGGFFSLNAVLSDDNGEQQGFSLGTRRVAILTVSPYYNAAAQELRGAA
jgi:hypothetical protein